MHTQVDMYKAARERLRAARLRGEDTEEFEYSLSALWSMMSSADRSAVLSASVNQIDQKRAA